MNTTNLSACAGSTSKGAVHESPARAFFVCTCGWQGDRPRLILERELCPEGRRLPPITRVVGERCPRCGAGVEQVEQTDKEIECAEAEEEFFNANN